MLIASEEPVLNIETYLALVMIGFAVYAVSKSKRKWRTVFWGVGSGAATVLLGVGLAQVFEELDTERFGAALFETAMLVGALTFLTHSRVTQRKTQQKRQRQRKQPRKLKTLKAVTRD